MSIPDIAWPWIIAAVVMSVTLLGAIFMGRNNNGGDK